jgi:phosphoserine/homoserine phosphotransferase
MKVVCLDFEGVLIPDVWPYIAKRSDISDLLVTTRDMKDYRELMDHRVHVCKENNLTLETIQGYIQELEPLEGALEMVQWIRSRYQFVILSDTFYEFAGHFVEALDYPSLFCHTIQYNQTKQQLEYALRQENQKQHAVKALQSLNFKVFASGDSYNDITMIEQADSGALFQAPEGVVKDYPQYQNLPDYEAMKKAIEKAFA